MIIQRDGDDIDRNNLPQILVLNKIVPLFYNHIMFLKSKFCSFPGSNPAMRNNSKAPQKSLHATIA
jgi:hypothetical protein